MTNIPLEPFVLVDGSSYLFRAFYALPPLTAKNGQQTGAIYGVINMLRKLIADFKPKQMVVVFDAKEKTFRHQLYKEYKANREETPQELAEQILPLQEIISAMGIPVIVFPGVEADDVIGTLAKQAEKQNLFSLISTGDKDLAQVVSEKIVLINTMSNSLLDQKGVEKKFYVQPSQIIDYLSLVGDTVDNIPGVPKVGPKTAVKWLDAYGCLDNIVKNANSITGKVGENLRATLSLLPLYKELTTIKTDVDLPCKLEQLLVQSQDIEKLKKLFKDLDFNKWLQDLNGTTKLQGQKIVQKEQSFIQEKTEGDLHKQQEKTSLFSKYKTILTKYDFNNLLLQLEKAKIIAIDTETTSLNYLDAKIVGLSFAIEKGIATYIPVDHDYSEAPEQLELQYVLEKLQPILTSPNITKVGHNLKYDLHVLANYGVSVQGPLYDTMLASYVFNSVAGRHNLTALAKRLLDYDMITFEQVAGKGTKKKSFNEVQTEEATAYAAEDADLTLQLYEYIIKQLKETPTLYKVFTELEMNLLPVLLVMERNGVLIDANLLQKQSVFLEKRLQELEEQTHTLAEETFNLNSPKQLQEILFNKMQLPVLQKTPTGQPSTAEATLQELALDYPLPKLILEYRQLSKLKSTYVDSLPLQINDSTGRVHTSYQQAIAATGRLSSTDPNLQNIPIRTEEGRKIRSAFIAPVEMKLLSADYSQIELRIMAHLAEDPVLLEAFAKGEDIHRVTASEVFNVHLEEVSPEQRRRAKSINFGLLYGMSAFGLAQQLGIERKDAEQYVDFYFMKFPKIKEFIEQNKLFARDNGYVETIFGRRFYLPDINAKNIMKRRAAERVAINAPMQGGQADLIKKAMIDIYNWQKESDIEFKMLMQVHDELIFEVPIGNIEKVKEKIISLMSNVAKLKVELVVSVGVGDNWDEAH